MLEGLHETHAPVDEQQQRVDVETLDQWLHTKRLRQDERTKLLARFAVGLRAFAAADYALAASVLDSAAEQASELGGSHAQNLLFVNIAEHCWEQAQMRRAA